MFTAEKARTLAESKNFENGGYEKFCEEILMHINGIASRGEYFVTISFNNFTIGFRSKLIQDLKALGYQVTMDESVFKITINWYTDSEKKKWYQVFNAANAEEESSGWVYLTRKEAEIVRYVTDEDNWDDPKIATFSGCFYIDLDSAKDELFMN